MKNSIITSLLVLLATAVFAQTDGLSYQAIIIDNKVQEIPGIDISGNYLSEGDIALRFSIFSEFEVLEYQETQESTTDKYGMVNLIIGRGEVTGMSPGLFDEINWDGTAKVLMVELSIEGNEFEELTRQELLFIPYAYHRDIYGSGSLTVQGESVLNGSFTVANQSLTTLSGDLIVQGSAVFEGNTNFQTINVADWSLLNGTLEVGDSASFNNGVDVLNESPTFLSGTLQVNGETTLSESLNVQGTASIYGPLDVYDENPTWLSGYLHVAGDAFLDQEMIVGGNTELEGTLTTNSTSNLNGQVTITADVNGNEANYNSYPLRVQGSNQGVAIKLDGVSQNAHNFVTFFDNSGNIHGRIEGETLQEMYTSFDYIWTYAGAVLDASMDAAEAGACAAQLDAFEVATNGAGSALKLAQGIEFITSRELNRGVMYQSGGADYAEYLEKSNPLEQFMACDVVGVKSGKISKKTEDAEHLLVISTNPIVLGNLPPDGREDLYEKVAFLGQVPVRIVGEVKSGDYILPSGYHDGLARAVNPEKLATSEFHQIIGIAWESHSGDGLNRVNIAIGLNTNDVARRVSKLEDDVQDLKNELALIRQAIADNGQPGENQEKANDQKEQDKSVATEHHSGTPGPYLDYLTDEEFENWLAESGHIFDREMAKLRTHFNEREINYQQYESLALIIDNPKEALRQMRNGDFMGSMWKSYEEKYNLRKQ